MYFFRTNYIKLDPQTAYQGMQHPCLILDVRDPVEYRVDHIENATNIPLAMLPNHIHQLDKNVPVYVYCFNGGKSHQACHLLLSHGFTQVYDIGGIMSWPYKTVK